MEESKASTIVGTVVDVSKFKQKTSEQQQKRMFPGLQYVTWKYLASERFPKPLQYVKTLVGNKVTYNCFMDSAFGWWESIEGGAKPIDAPDAWD